MIEKYFFHRIKAEGSVFNKGIEVHDNLDSAIRAFYGYWTYAYNNPASPNVTFVSCRITDGSGAVVGKYDMTWLKDAGMANRFFMHYIRHDGGTFAKNIDIFDDFDAAKSAGMKEARRPNAKTSPTTQKMSDTISLCGIAASP